MKTLKSRILYKWKMLEYSVVFLAVCLVAPFFRGQKRFRHLWIVSERGKDAGDNAFYLFCYIRKIDPCLNIRYIIAKDSPDADKVKAAGTVIRYKSLEHYLAIALSEVKISTHLLGYTPLDYLFAKFERRGLIRGKRIFLQHGVTKDSPDVLFYKNSRPDLFVCAAAPEAEYIGKHFGHPRGVVQLLGFCRYDGLPLAEEEQKGKRSILVMPTWRVGVSDYSAPRFLKSGYYLQWSEMLLSDDLGRLLEEYDYDLYFYPHFSMQKFTGLFKGGSQRVHIASREQYGVQELLIHTDIMVTDFSSVLFDYVYMKKPAVYYQPGQGDRPGYHFEAGWFDYETNGFGKVARSLPETLEELEAIMRRGGKMEEKYLERSRCVFPYHDHENCKRNYEAIMKLVNHGD